MPDRLPPPPPKFSWARLSKTVAFWMIVILVPVIFFRLTAKKGAEAPEISYSEFMSAVDRHNVKSVEIEEQHDIQGEFQSAERVGGRDVQHFNVTLPFTVTDIFAQKMTDAGIPMRAKKARPGVISIVVTLLPWLVLIGFWLFMFRQVQAGSGRAFAFGKSKAKLLTGDTPKLTFADVAGADEAKVELEEIIEFLKDPQKFTRLGGRLPKGALLIGPPGTGKTLLAKAVAGEAGRPFFSMSGSDFVEMFVGVGASRVRDLFEQGKAHAPCIIFIDEIDAVGRHRGAGLGGGHDEREQTLNQLLVEMDGFESNDGVILLAATNRPDVLDPALLRPGRFDRQIVVDAPDVKGREGILRVHTRKIPLANDVSLGRIAKGTPGLSGADLANLVNEAALLAARRNKSQVDMQDFEDAKDKVMLGVERKSLVLTEDERKLTAYHEAGHAIVSLKIPGLDPLHKVTIVPRGRALGLTTWLPEEDRHNYTRYWLEGRLASAFGGRVAEELVFGRSKVTTGASGDIEQATNIARRMVTQFGMSDKIGMIAVGDQEQEIFLGRELAHRREVSERMAETVDAEVKQLIDDAYNKAMEILIAHRVTLDRMAVVLLERETIDREEIDMIARGEDLPPRSSTPPVPPVPLPISGGAPERRPVPPLVPNQAPSPA
ncbi:MAG TPA: ATP-dependent zinc metalloprotease FtsH [Gemmatimonadales bacterium]|jgi:cell division protease FtsH